MMGGPPVRAVRAGLWVTLVSLVISGCAGPAGQSGDPAAQPVSAGPKRVTAAVRGDVPTLVPGAPGPVPGLAELAELLNPGLTAYGPGGSLVPRLAEQVPTVENGLWRVLPDGKMEVVWKLRPNAVWHDGAPVTADDFVFRHRVRQDRRTEWSAAPVNRFLEEVSAPDPRTLVVKWNAIYLQADAGFDFPFPQHILGPLYETGDVERMLAHPYWTQEFVGVGPFKIREYTVGSGAILTAFDSYFLGRPKVDIVEIKFIVDPNTIAANVLAGGVDVTFGGRLPLDWAQEIQDRSAGTAKFGTSTANPMVVYQNLFNPVPAAILQPEFRRALVHALDRQQMMDVLVADLTDVAHATMLNPSRTDEFMALNARSVKYAYDPRRASQIVEGLGFRKGSDGLYQDGEGQRLVLELRTSQGDIQQERSLFSTADFWQQIGLGTERVIVPSARRGDDEYRNTFPGFDIRRNPHRPDTLKSYFHSGNAPFPERNYRGSAYIRYVNPEFDALIDLHDRTVPLAERRETLGKLVNFITDQVLVIGLFYDVEVTVMTNRLINIHTRGDQMGEAWNPHEWDVK